MIHVYVFGYVKVFSHDTTGGLFIDDGDALSKNPSFPDAKLYSILKMVPSISSFAIQRSLGLVAVAAMNGFKHPIQQQREQSPDLRP